MNSTQDNSPPHTGQLPRECDLDHDLDRESHLRNMAQSSPQTPTPSQHRRESLLGTLLSVGKSCKTHPGDAQPLKNLFLSSPSPSPTSSSSSSSLTTASNALASATLASSSTCHHPISSFSTPTPVRKQSPLQYQHSLPSRTCSAASVVASSFSCASSPMPAPFPPRSVEVTPSDSQSSAMTGRNSRRGSLFYSGGPVRSEAAVTESCSSGEHAMTGQHGKTTPSPGFLYRKQPDNNGMGSGHSNHFNGHTDPHAGSASSASSAFSSTSNNTNSNNNNNLNASGMCPPRTETVELSFFHSGPGSDSEQEGGHSTMLMVPSSPGQSLIQQWHRLGSFVRALVSQSLVSRLYSRRPHFSSVGTSSWSIVRILNTCHLLYLVPVTTITVARLLTTDVICDEQLFSWLTVQAVLFLSQIVSACYILQRQTMSTRITILDQRSRILLLVFMIWTLIGVGFLGADSNAQESTCMSSNDPVYSLAFKIIVFHVSLIGFYFLPCSSLLLSRLLPNSISSGLSRTATKPMIDQLGSIPMAEGLFGGDPEEATCAICLGDYTVDETIRFLPCRHHFHLECVDQWLLTDKSCPLCKHDIDRPMDNDRNSHRHSTHPASSSSSSSSSIGATDGFQVIVV